MESAPNIASSSRAPVVARTLRHATLGVLGLGFAVLVGAQIALGRFLYTDGFQEAEQRDMLARVRHAQAVLAQTSAQLRSVALDYGIWEDTYAFMSGRYAAYPGYNFYQGTFDRLQIDAALFIAPDNRVALAMYRDSNGGVQPADDAALAAMTAPMLLSRIRAIQGATTGYTSIRGIPYVWSASLVRPNQANVPSAGNVVFLRALDEKFTAAQSPQIDARLQVSLAERSENFPAHVVASLSDLRLRSAGQAQLMGDVTLGRTVAGEEVRLTITAERPLLATVRSASAYFLYTSIAGGLLIMIGVSWFLSRRVLNPLERVAATVQHIGATAALNRRVPAPPHQDEIAAVVAALNRMLADLESKRDVESARDAALEASRLKSEFLATMSHEIRTPMNGVLGMLELVASSPLTAEQRQRVDTAHQSATNLLALLNDILDLSRLESGRLELEHAPTDLRAVVMQVGELMQPRAMAKGLTLEWWVDEAVHAGYQADPGRLRQVLLNLVGNAVKFTERGHVRIEVWARALDSERDSLTLSVSDTGVGIAADAIETIFDAFTQENASTTRRFGGSGLGLSICRRLVSLMGGTIQVRSVQNVGSAFKVELELSRCEMALDPTVPMPDLAPLELHVLVAEDNRVNQLVVSAMLEKLGCSYEIASDGAQAIAIYRERPRRFAVILLDVNMPNVDGYEAARTIRDFERAALPGRCVPIIALTANAMNGDRERCIAAGMDEHLAKPFALGDLRRTLVTARRSRSVVEFPRVARANTP